MTIDELLIPRYKAVYKDGSHYPNSPYADGEIITLRHPDTAATDSEKVYLIAAADYCPKHPHLFSPLKWYDMRDEKDLPEYLIYTDHRETVIEKVIKYTYHHSIPHLLIGFEYGKFVAGSYSRYSMNGWLPSTEEAYKKHISIIETLALQNKLKQKNPNKRA